MKEKRKDRYMKREEIEEGVERHKARVTTS